jgi:enamine deaminase RidA (YjgF/YER057c/UK114 family)
MTKCLENPEVARPPLSIRIDHGAVSEYFINVQDEPGRDPGIMFENLDRELAAQQAVIAKMDIIGRINNWDCRPRQEYCFDCDKCPTNGHSYLGSCPITGVQAHAITGANVQPVWFGGRIVGTIYEDEHARYCQLKDLHPNTTRQSRSSQAADVFYLMEQALSRVGMTFHNVVRTWLFCEDILAWYHELNDVRHTFFRQRGVFDKFVPASTGVGGTNIFGAALTADVFAVAPKTEDCRFFAVPSPLQCAALEYGSGFSRAAEVETPDLRRLFVSGTASIKPGGATAYVGDVDKQVALTMDVVAAILEARDMSWEDVTRGVAFFRLPKDTPKLAEYCKDKGLNFPVVVARNTVCRDDLLFELEVDALKKRD